MFLRLTAVEPTQGKHGYDTLKMNAFTLTPLLMIIANINILIA